MAVLFASPYFTALDSSGTPISGAKAKFFLAGTTTPQEVWADRALTTTRGATVTADSAGRFPDIWVPETISYRVQILDASDVLLEDVDYAIQATATTAATTTAGAEVKNILVNGGMDVWSLGTSFSNVGGAATLSETADGWFVSQVSTAGNSVTRQTGTSGSSRYGLRFGRPAANTTTGQLRVMQGIETGLVYRFAGKQVTVSFWAYQGANFSGTNLAITLATGTAEGEALTGLPNGTWTGQVNAISQVQGLTTTATRYQFTATLAANIKEIGLMLAYTPSGTAGANDWVQIENVQIEGAGQATEFAARQTALDYLEARVAQPVSSTNFRAAFGLGTGDSPQFAAINLGNASDTTITRVSAGVIAVEGGTVPLENRANTFASSVVQTFSGLVIANRTTATANPDNSGSATTNIQARLGASNVGSGGYGIDIGVSNADGSVWVQARDWSNFATNSTLRLQPNGGIVTIGGNTAYHAGNLPGTNVNWTSAQWISGAGGPVLMLNRTDSAAFHMEMRGAGNTRGYIGADATYSLITYNAATSVLMRQTHASGLTEFLYNVDVVGASSSLRARTRPLTTTTGTLVAGDANCAGTLTGGITLPNSVFAANDMVFVNAGAANRTITRGAGIAMHLNGTDVATATLPANTGGGIFWETASKAILTGAFQ